MTLVGLGTVSPIAAQEWNSQQALQLIEAATLRREQPVTRDGLSDYTSRAHGVVLFLAQVGDGFTTAPRLVKADELVSEVYWRAPNSSKQRIIGWRERTDLPTDIAYHRDHLGIVQNDFGDRIRLGDGHEVRDVVHPLALLGRNHYDFLVVDSLSIELPERLVRVYHLRIRPRDERAPGIVGSVFLDAGDGGVVRFRFSFTRASYRDDSIEDITIVLENGLWSGRYWLPRTQEIEIRRRSSWFDIPARGIIRATWDVDEYQFDTGLPPSSVLGPEIVAAPESARDSFAWDVPLRERLREVTGQTDLVTLADARAEAREIISAELVNGLPRVQPGVRSVSSILHFNRVEGLSPGFGGVFRFLAAGQPMLSYWAGYGVADRAAKGRLRFEVGGDRKVGIHADRVVRDVMDSPAGSTLMNSLLAQEWGHDYGDYYLLERLGMNGAAGGSGFTVRGGLSWWRVESAQTRASPANGEFRPNPTFGPGRFGVTEAEVIWAPESEFEKSVHVATEFGFGDSSYWRGTLHWRLFSGAGPTTIATTGWFGVGTRDLPRHRSFAVGGRGTLVGEAFRAWGGTRAAVVTFEWRVPVPGLAIPLGAFGSSGGSALVAPFVGALWAGGDSDELPWSPSQGARPVLGIALEWLHGLVRAEFGYSVRDSRLRGSVDFGRYFWSIL